MKSDDSLCANAKADLFVYCQHMAFGCFAQDEINKVP